MARRRNDQLITLAGYGIRAEYRLAHYGSLPSTGGHRFHHRVGAGYKSKEVDGMKHEYIHMFSECSSEADQLVVTRLTQVAGRRIARGEGSLRGGCQMTSSGRPWVRGGQGAPSHKSCVLFPAASDSSTFHPWPHKVAVPQPLAGTGQDGHPLLQDKVSEGIKRKGCPHLLEHTPGGQPHVWSTLVLLIEIQEVSKSGGTSQDQPPTHQGGLYHLHTKMEAV